MYVPNYFKNENLTLFDVLPILTNSDSYSGEDFAFFAKIMPKLTIGHEFQHFYFNQSYH